MWMNSFVGDAARSSILIVPTLPFLGAGGNWITAETEAPEEAISDLAWKKHQMPAWHLITADGQGITLVNIGVGPSNAKTICDHLAVLRPDVWLMLVTVADYVKARPLAIMYLHMLIYAMITFLMRFCRPIFLFRALLKCNVRFMTPQAGERQAR